MIGMQVHPRALALRAAIGVAGDCLVGFGRAPRAPDGGLRALPAFSPQNPEAKVRQSGRFPADSEGLFLAALPSHPLAVLTSGSPATPAKTTAENQIFERFALCLLGALHAASVDAQAFDTFNRDLLTRSVRS
jgi:hypothetical protein